MQGSIHGHGICFPVAQGGSAEVALLGRQRTGPSRDIAAQCPAGQWMAYKWLEEATFTWPAIKAGIMALNHAQFEALFAGLDWRKIKSLETRPPAAAE